MRMKPTVVAARRQGVEKSGQPRFQRRADSAKLQR
jgi:hypothetical protein